MASKKNSGMASRLSARQMGSLARNVTRSQASNLSRSKGYGGSGG